MPLHIGTERGATKSTDPVRACLSDEMRQGLGFQEVVLARHHERPFVVPPAAVLLRI